MTSGAVRDKVSTVNGRKSLPPFPDNTQRSPQGSANQDGKGSFEDEKVVCTAADPGHGAGPAAGDGLGGGGEHHFRLSVRFRAIGNIIHLPENIFFCHFSVYPLLFVSF